jgi:uncharacterized protein YndB with AHSA1/START domain
MSELSCVHSTFTIERTLDATPTRVFSAFANPEHKQMWFRAPHEGVIVKERVFDFRVGGSERLASQWPNGMVARFDARYFDIVADRRIVYAYEMHIDDKKISVSLATVTTTPSGSGTRLVITEQGAFLDGYDDAGSRERGTNALIDQLVASVSR